MATAKNAMVSAIKIKSCIVTPPPLFWYLLGKNFSGMPNCSKNDDDCRTKSSEDQYLS
jgi:hypothetical protein